MTVYSRESSEYDGEPYELYRAAFGVSAADVARYTTAPFDITRNNEVYKPLPIDRSDIIASPGLDDSIMTVEVPHDCSLAQQYKLYPPAQPITLNIWRGHFGEPRDSEILIWTGRILWCDVENEFSAKLECEPLNGSLKRVGLRRYYQYMCPHTLYKSTTCGADKLANQFPTVALSYSGNQISVSSVGVSAEDPRLIGGSIEWVTNGLVYARTIIDVDYQGGNTVLTVIGQFRDLQPDQEVNLYRGCDRTLTDCRDTFNNAINFGGQPFIPTENPTGKTGTFY